MTMNFIKYVTPALCAGILLFSGCVQEIDNQDPMTSDETTMPDVSLLYELEEQRVEYFENQEYEALAEMMSESMTYTHSSSTMDDKDAILAGLTSGDVIYREFNHSDLSARFFTPNVGVIHGNSHIDLTISGEDVMVPLRFSIIYVNTDGEWKMEMWHSTRLPEE